MKLFENMRLILWISLLGFCYARVEDYLKGIEFNRSFSPIEGKVVKISVKMDEDKYNEMVKAAQLSPDKFVNEYNKKVPDANKFETTVEAEITVDGKTTEYKEVTLKLSGNSSKTYAKIGYNLKLKKQNFYGVNNLRLRADYNDVSHIRSKLAIDLINKWNIPTVQETFAHFYINDKYLGFYSLLDSIKPAWIKNLYNLPEDEKVTTLYSCSKQTFKFDAETVKDACENEEKGYDTSELVEFVEKIYDYKSETKLKEHFENIENIRKVLIYEYLFSTIDNFIMAGNNYNFYKKDDGKWVFIPVDFNIVFFLGVENITNNENYKIRKHRNLIDYARVEFKDWYAPDVRKPFIKILYEKHKDKFIETLEELLITGFNPDELFPRIDELANFLRPHVQRDNTPDRYRQLPGRINREGRYYPSSMENFWAAIYDDEYGGGVGLKKFITEKFNAVCRIYGLDREEILRKARRYRRGRKLEIRIYDAKQKYEKLEELYSENGNGYLKMKMERLAKRIGRMEERLRNKYY